MRKITEEQKEKAKARREQFRKLWKTVADTPELERIQLANRYGFRNPEGREYSLTNTMLLALQFPAGSVFGGFRQWLKNGRVVKKGEHGSMIWFPRHKREATGEAPETGTTEKENEMRFLIGTVFDISQTEEMKPENACAELDANYVEA